jgi:hypothetical protein
MANGRVAENGQAEIGPVLVFRRAADRHIFVPTFPSPAGCNRKPVDPFRNEQKSRSLRRRIIFPAFRAPFVRVLYEKSEVKQLYTISPEGFFHYSRPFLRRGSVEILSLAHNEAFRFHVVPLVHPVHITVLAAGTQFMAAMHGSSLPSHVSPSSALLSFYTGKAREATRRQRDTGIKIPLRKEFLSKGIFEGGERNGVR